MICNDTTEYRQVLNTELNKLGKIYFEIHNCQGRIKGVYPGQQRSI